MSFLKLIVITPGRASRELRLEDGVVAIGRALDNTISLEDDTNVSRYHAEIEKRGQDFWVVDLGSSNGTAVNDAPVEFEHSLCDGDLIGIGGSTIIEFHLSDTPWQTSRAAVHTAAQSEREPPRAHTEPARVAQSSQSSIDAPRLDFVTAIPQPVAMRLPAMRSSPLLIVAGVGGGLLLAALIGVLIYKGVSHGCNPSVRVVSPQNGTVIRRRTPIHVETEDAKCIERVIYKIDGVEVATSETNPYDIVLEPTQMQALSGGNHILSVVVEDQEGNLTVSQDTVLLAFDTGATNQRDPANRSEVAVDNQTNTVAVQAGAVDVNSMADRLAGQISRKSGYIFDRDFVDLIRVRSNEYRIGGYSGRARQYRREINKAFRDQGLDPLLGYLLAMSRSKFDVNATGSGLGLWQMPLSLAQSQGYLAAGESEATLKDPKRSAEIAAAYTKALVSTFELPDDFMFAVACFGQPLSEVGKVRAQLATLAPDPVDRRDFFKMVKSGVVKGEQVDRVVRFFAAGIVGENPQTFGLSNDERFSSLF